MSWLSGFPRLLHSALRRRVSFATSPGTTDGRRVNAPSNATPAVAKLRSQFCGTCMDTLVHSFVFCFFAFFPAPQQVAAHVSVWKINTAFFPYVQNVALACVVSENWDFFLTHTLKSDIVGVKWTNICRLIAVPALQVRHLCCVFTSTGNPLAAYIHGPLSNAATAEGTYGQTR